MRDAWRNDRFFSRLAFGLGLSPAIQEQQQNTVDPNHLMGGQPVTYPATNDYDTPDTIQIDHNRMMPYHEGAGGADAEIGEINLEAEVGQNLKSLTEEQPRAPMSQHELWSQSYPDDDGVHLGQVDPSPYNPSRFKRYRSFDGQLFPGVARELESDLEKLRAAVPLLAQTIQQARASRVWNASLREKYVTLERIKRDIGKIESLLGQSRVGQHIQQGATNEAWIAPDGEEHSAPQGHSSWMREHGPQIGMPPEAPGSFGYQWMYDQGWIRTKLYGAQGAVSLQRVTPQNLGRVKQLVLSLKHKGATQIFVESEEQGSATVNLTPTGRPDFSKIDALAAGRVGQRTPWVAVDLDGTILEEVPRAAPGKRDRQLPFGAVKPGAARALAELARLGWRVSIFTARFGDESLNDSVVARWAHEIAEYLKSKSVVFTDVWVGRKPRADFFVDDKAIRFEGDWAAILEALTLVDSPPRNSGEDTFSQDAGGGPFDYVEDPNNFNDPLGDRQSLGVDRPRDLEGLQ